jgi:peptidoglycan/LPS O-acetylase OafA/YrhL
MAGGRPFRADINGLRAIAVLAVLLFHFRVPGFGGGFAGVDIFYVISGFLMTQIIVGRLGEQRFSLVGFYAARAQRIVPALVGLCAVLLVGGAFFIDPHTYGQLGSEAAWALTFLSNFLYARDAGYFAPGADESWLLHTWSLAVEWQFYLAFPLLLMALRRFAWLWERRGPVLAVLAIVSLALSIGSAEIAPKVGFYMLPTRAWEMLAGGLVAIYATAPQPRFRSALLAAGAALLLASILLATPQLPWPSFWALGPVLGTAFIIMAAHNDAAWTRIPGVQEIGRWSYSIYLWHWPLAVGQRYFELGDGIVVRVVLIAASVALGFLSYRLLETGLRKLAFTGPVWKRAALPLIVAALGAAFLIDKTDGLAVARERLLPPAEQAVAADYRAAWRDWRFKEACPELPCRIGNPAARDVLVIGNSHAQQFASRYAERLSPDGSKGVTFDVMPGCPALPGVARKETEYSYCRSYPERAYKRASEEGFRRLVLISSWSGDFKEGDISSALCFDQDGRCVAPASNAVREVMTREAFKRLALQIRALTDQGVEVVVFLPFPSSPDNNPHRLYKQMFLGWPRPERASLETASERSAFARGLLTQYLGRSGADLIDPAPQLCQRDCPIYADGKAIYRDTGHIRATAVEGPTFDFMDRYILDPTPLGAAP